MMRLFSRNSQKWGWIRPIQIFTFFLHTFAKCLQFILWKICWFLVNLVLVLYSYLSNVYIILRDANKWDFRCNCRNIISFHSYNHNLCGGDVKSKLFSFFSSYFYLIGFMVRCNIKHWMRTELIATKNIKLTKT